MRLFGYARVSTSQQSLETQIKKLEGAGVKRSRIFADKESGKNMDRSQFQLLKLKVEKGDTNLSNKTRSFGKKYRRYG